MRISHRHRFVYIAIPKTGSTSVRKMLDKYSDVFPWDLGLPEHVSAGRIKSIFEEKGWDWGSYHKFAVVRSPWARALSNHNYRIKIGSKPIQEWHRKNNPEYYDYCVGYVKNIPDFKTSLRMSLFLPSQYDLVAGDDGKTLMDSICRLENLQDDLRGVWAKIGLDPADLDSIPHENKTTYMDYRLAYDDESARIIAKKFSKDIEMFGYSF